MWDNKSQRVICELSEKIEGLILNQNEMAARVKQTNYILKSMQKVTEELKEENARLYHENKLLLKKENEIQRKQRPTQPMPNNPYSSDESTSEDDDAEPSRTVRV